MNISGINISFDLPEDDPYISLNTVSKTSSVKGENNEEDSEEQDNR